MARCHFNCERVLTTHKRRWLEDFVNELVPNVVLFDTSMYPFNVFVNTDMTEKISGTYKRRFIFSLAKDAIKYPRQNVSGTLVRAMEAHYRDLTQVHTLSNFVISKTAMREATPSVNFWDVVVVDYDFSGRFIPMKGLVLNDPLVMVDYPPVIQNLIDREANLSLQLSSAADRGRLIDKIYPDNDTRDVLSNFAYRLASHWPKGHLRNGGVSLNMYNDAMILIEALYLSTVEHEQVVLVTKDSDFSTFLNEGYELTPPPQTTTAISDIFDKFTAVFKPANVLIYTIIPSCNHPKPIAYIHELNISSNGRSTMRAVSSKFKELY